MQWLFTCPPVRSRASFWQGSRFGACTPFLVRMIEQWAMVLVVQALVVTAPQAQRGVIWHALSNRMVALLLMSVLRPLVAAILTLVTAKLRAVRVAPLDDDTIAKSAAAAMGQRTMRRLSSSYL